MVPWVHRINVFLTEILLKSMNIPCMKCSRKKEFTPDMAEKLDKKSVSKLQTKHNSTGAFVLPCTVSTRPLEPSEHLDSCETD